MSRKKSRSGLRKSHIRTISVLLAVALVLSGVFPNLFSGTANAAGIYDTDLAEAGVSSGNAADTTSGGAIIVNPEELVDETLNQGLNTFQLQSDSAYTMDCFSDDFNDGNADGWTTYGSSDAGNRGVWSVNASGQYTIGGCPGAKTVAEGTSFTDLVYEADISVSGLNSDGTGFLFRVSNPVGNVADGYNGYYVALRVDKKLQLGRVTGNNVWKELSVVAVPCTSGHLKVVAVGNNIKVYINDVQYLDYTDNDGSQVTSPGAIGLRTWWGTSQIDNISVRDYNTEPLEVPQFSIQEGVYNSEKTIEMTGAATGAEIRYTIDGSIPDSNSNLYASPITISKTTLFKAKAFMAGRPASDMAKALYVIATEGVQFSDDFDDGDRSAWAAYEGLEAGRTQTEANGIYTFTKPRGDKAVTGSGYTDFILEGEVNPFASGQSSGFSFRVSNPGNGADKLDGYFAGINTSNYVEICKFSSAGSGVWTAIKNIPAVVNKNAVNHLKIIGVGQNFYIYLNGKLVADFTDNSHSEGGIALRAWNDNGNVTYDNVSAVKLSPLKQQAAAPLISPEACTFADTQEVTISCATADAVIHFTTDGNTPTAASPVYSGKIMLTGTATVKAFAEKAGMDDSVVQSVTYTKATASFTDDFSDGNSNGWTTYGGTWSVADGAYNVNAGGGFKAVADGVNFADFTYEADVSFTGGTESNNTGLIFRASEPKVGADMLKGYYAGICRDGKAQIGRFNNNWQELATIPYPVVTGQVYHIKVTANGSNIDMYIDGNHVASVVDSMFTSGTVGMRTWYVNARYDNISVTTDAAAEKPVYDWSWVKGAVFVPTNVVNEIQQWKEYDHEVNDRELSYAHAYGINLVRVYLHNLLWENNSAKLLNDFEDFLSLADKYDIKVEVVFFDDCWDDHPTYDYDPAISPRYGAHNSRWVEAPGDDYKALYNNADGVVKAKLKAYVEGIAGAHLNDGRVAFWNTYNEPSNGESGIYDQVTKQLMNDSRIWIKEMGSKIPVSATAGQFSGAPFSDFLTWHPYEASYPKTFNSVGRTFTADASVLADECMQRNNQSVPGIVENYGNKGIGFVMWELGIGRDNCRFPWGSDVNPLTYEPEKPFHGVVYPDGHPWSVEDVKALKGNAFDTLPLFRVQYFKDSSFTNIVKTSITPRIDFDLGDEKGTGSPDASAGIDKDNFSIRWAGSIRPSTSGSYTFYADSDNIAGIWVGNTKVVDKTGNSREEVSGIINLTAGQQYPVKIEYVHAAGSASLHVKWAGPGLVKTVLLPVLSTSPVTAVSLNNDTLVLGVGDSRKLFASLEPLDAANQKVTWSTDNPAFVKVDQDGTVKALAEGSAVITVTTEDGNYTDTCTVTVTRSSKFGNPIVPVSSGAGSADPSVVFKDGYYYYCKSENDGAILVAKARRLQDIGTAPRVTVYTPPAGTMYSKELWAPELQYLNGKWYIYFAADNGSNANHRMYVLEGNSQDPQGSYTLKGKISDPTDKWAIDGAVLENDGRMYFVWSGWEGNVDGRQDLYIAPMSNPWTISGDRVRISSPEKDWEKKAGPAYINEGPEILMKDGKIFIVYSASGSWSDDYCLGMLTNTDGDVLNPAAWTKTGPVFSKATGAYGTGHNSFTVSPDGTEDWIVYHADKNSGGSWANRSVRAQKFTWNADGTPNFGTPAGYGELIEQPSGTPEVNRYTYEAEDAVIGGNAKIVESGNAYGGKVVGNLNTVDSDYVLFNVNATKAGTYTLTVMADNGSAEGLAEQKATVNDGAPQTVAYKNFGWGNFNPASLTVTLKEGLNTIKLAKKTAFAQIDRIVLEELEDSGVTVPVEALSLNKQNITVTKGQSATITASIRPIAGTNKAVTISTTDNQIAAAVKTGEDIASGTVTITIDGIAPGSAIIKIASAENPEIYAECEVAVRDLPADPDLSGYTVDNFDGATLDTSTWSIWNETPEDWSIGQGAVTIHTQPTDVYQDNNSQNNVFLRSIPASGDFEVVTKLTAPIALNHQQAGLFVWKDADNFVKLAHVWVNGRTLETAYEVSRTYKKPGNFATHPGGDTVTLKIKKLGNVYTTYYWDGYSWIQASDPVTATLGTPIKVGFFANNIVASGDRINAVFEYFAIKEISGGVDLDRKALTIGKGASSKLTNNGLSGANVTWSSGDNSIATVDQNGLVTAVSSGRVIITAQSKAGDFKDRCVITVPETETQPEVLFEDDFSSSNSLWSIYGGTWQVVNGEYTVNSGSGYKAVLNKNFTDYVLEADVQITGGTEAGLVFRVSNPSTGADAFSGYYLGINAAQKSAVLGKMENGSWTEIANKKLNIKVGEWTHMKVVVDQAHIQAFINDNPLNVNAYPKFDLVENTHIATGKIGLRTFNAAAKFDNVKVSSYKAADQGKTYTNSVLPDTADPYVLQYNGTYYLYGTNTDTGDTNKSQGIKVYTSTDLVNWTDKGLALKNEDSWGNKWFWAPEVVERNGTFYMYYAVEERLAVATGKSPLGPFVQEVQEPIKPDTVKIDAHVFKDDDGKQYLYFVRFNNANEIWVAELNDDMKTIKEETMTFCFRPTQAWEQSQKQPVANINEGPFVIKHNGLYYLTYSGNHFESPDYGVGYATSTSPMGPWTKYEYNPIMKSNLVVPGAGHHSLVYSPDGTELFMVYHTHYNTGSTEPRKLSIDRVHFVPQGNGLPDAMEVWGPTVTPQPMPSNGNVIAPVTSITIAGENGVNTITAYGGTLKMTKVVTPENADDSVIWSIVSGSEYAAISADGVLTAKANGIVTVKAVAKDGSGVESNVYTVTITNQNKPAEPSNPPSTPPASNSGSSSGSSGTPAETKPQTAQLDVKPVLNGTGRTAQAAVSSEDLKKALEAAKLDNAGNKTVTIIVSEVKGAEQYALELPKTSVTSVQTNLLKIDSPVATIIVPGNLFNTKDVKGDKVEISIGTGDKSKVRDEAAVKTIGDRPVIEIKASADGKALKLDNPQTAVTVSLDYKPAAGELKNSEHITVWAIDENGNTRPVPSGKYDAETGQVTFTAHSFGDYAVVYVNKTFNDLNNYLWAKEKIEVMAAKGIINGTSETTYSPAKNITRADFVVLLVNALGLNAAPGGNFEDVKKDSYYYNAVAIAKELGIVTGVGNNKFNPAESISRQDMMVIAANAMKVAGKAISKGSASDIAGFKDRELVSAYAEDAAAALVKAGIIAGSGNALNPQKTATRAETAVIIYNIYNK